MDIYFLLAFNISTTYGWYPQLALRSYMEKHSYFSNLYREGRCEEYVSWIREENVTVILAEKPYCSQIADCGFEEESYTHFCLFRL